ncbi:hypothetical protein HLB42_11755 [Deinococcus sp. D7000]|nr:hypothetical protein HLB42_11755 [Deinococcus sp. D7000]
MTSLHNNEKNALLDFQQKDRQLRKHLADHPLDEEASVLDTLVYIQNLSSVLGNIKNHASAVACILARHYLEQHHEIKTYDACQKAQGARGIDIECDLIGGGKILGEIKTTIPYGNRKLGAQQAESFKKDLARLTSDGADHKYFFVVDSDARREAELLIGKKGFDPFIKVIDLITDFSISNTIGRDQ